MGEARAPCAPLSHGFIIRVIWYFFHYLLRLRWQNGPDITYVPLWGEGQILPPPPCRIFSITENCSRYRHETFSTFSSINLTSSITVQKKKSVNKILRKLHFSDAIFCLWVKNCNCLKAFKISRFEKIHDQKAIKDVKLTTLQTAISDFW